MVGMSDSVAVRMITEALFGGLSDVLSWSLLMPGLHHKHSICSMVREKWHALGAHDL